MEQGKGWKEVTRGEETRDTVFVSRSSLPLQEGTSAFGEVRYHKGNRSHKGFTLFSSQEHHQGVLSSPLKVLFEVAQPSRKARATSQLEGSQLTEVQDRESCHQGAQQQESPQQETPYKDPHKGDLGLPGFPMETASIRNPFGGKVDQLLLFKIPGGIAKI